MTTWQQTKWVADIDDGSFLVKNTGDWGPRWFTDTDPSRAHLFDAKPDALTAARDGGWKDVRVRKVNITTELK